ncbi:MAG: hypothetical protein HOW73_44090 [Polyangiaceae bacterium]|nr:hypothetical protein [Polyangiaceae bacterium]
MSHEIRAFSSRPCLSVLNLVRPIEQLDPIEEVLADLGAEGQAHVLFAPDTDDGALHTYLGAWAADLDGTLTGPSSETPHRRRWARTWMHGAPGLERRPSFDGDPDPVASFLRWVDAAAERLEGFAIPVVLVASVHDATTSTTRDALRRCACGIGATRTQLVLLDSTKTSLFADRSISIALSRAAEQPALPAPERMRRLLDASEVASFCGRHAEAMELVAKARKLAKPGIDEILVALHSGHALLRAGDVLLAASAYDRGLELELLCKEEIPVTIVASLVVGMADCEARSGAPIEAEELYQLGTDLYRQAGDAASSIPVEIDRGEILRRIGRAADGKRCVRAALETALGLRADRT